LRGKSGIFSKVFLWLGGSFLALAVGFALGGHRMQWGNFQWRRLFVDLYPNISTGFFSIAITILVIDGVTRHRAAQDEKRRLVFQAASPDASHAIEAVRLLRLRHWFSTALEGADLSDANLEGAQLQEANLKQSKLNRANLTGADLYRANLQGASLNEARLSDCNFLMTNLRGANMFSADLSDAVLRGADLSGANLLNATIAPSQLADATLTAETVLPDGLTYESITALRSD
jgi:hypothetical protein